jgi:hypothetical protein
VVQHIRGQLLEAGYSADQITIDEVHRESPAGGARRHRSPVCGQPTGPQGGLGQIEGQADRTGGR